MLKKLLKYDLKWVFEPLIVFYVLAIVFSCIVRVVESYDTTLILLIIDKVCCGVVISMTVSILINCFMRNWVRFINNIYKDESYLTHTLPVSRNNIFLSKVLTSIITLGISVIVIIISIAICALNKDTWIILKETLETSAIYFDSSIFNLIMVVVVAIFFELLFVMLSGILGIIIGHRANNLRMVKSILIGFLIYILLSSLSIGILYIGGVINSDIMNIFNSTFVSSNVLKVVMIIGIVIYLLYDLGIYIVGNKLLNNGIDVY